MNSEDCTRFFILTTSPAHEGTLVLEQKRYSGFWVVTYCPRLPHLFREASYVRRKVKKNLCLSLYASRLTKRNSGVAGVVPSYSGGTTRDSHPLPFTCSVYVEGDNRKDRLSLSSKVNRATEKTKKAESSLHKNQSWGLRDRRGVISDSSKNRLHQEMHLHMIGPAVEGMR